MNNKIELFYKNTRKKGETMTNKKAWKSILTTALSAMLLFSACGTNGETSESSSQEPHKHVWTQKLSSREATCIKEGRLASWYCEDCGKYFLDAAATKETTLEQTILPKVPHKPIKTEGTLETCVELGIKDSWTCTECCRIFLDQDCTEKVESSELTIPMTAHNLQHVDEVPVQGLTDGVKEHWTCLSCNGYFADEKGWEEIEKEDTILYSLMNVTDFLVEVPEGRDPVVLQLTDTQFIDGAQIRPGREGVSKTFYATSKMDQFCFDYLRETIEATNPDLIIMTGDNIYGEFDDNGSVWLKLIEFMESFEIPWAPIFGNHDNESAKGVDWQCEQLENAEHCLFEQKELTGNGNYSVGIKQGGKLTRVFYMLDSNGCGNASETSLKNTHFRRETGFGKDQIEWYTKQINFIKELSPETKFSFAYHIQTAVFADAYKKYGFNQSDENININIDTYANKTAGDFGFIGNQLKGAWDEDKKIYNGMKELGVDSVFVGHEHENSASVVYEGIRFQFGQKSSQYDRYNYIDANGNISNVFGQNPAGTTPLMGGSVVVLSQTDASIKDAYIYYCGFENGQIDWSAYNK